MILDTISNQHDLNRWFLHYAEAENSVWWEYPQTSWRFSPALVVFGDRSLEGSLIGGIADTREMMQFAHSHGLSAEIELVQPDEIEAAWNRLHEGDVQYRFVVDLEQLDRSRD